MADGHETIGFVVLFIGFFVVVSCMSVALGLPSLFGDGGGGMCLVVGIGIAAAVLAIARGKGPPPSE